MFRKSGVVLMMLLCIGSGFAQSLNGFEVDINLKTAAFGLEKNEKSDVELRRKAGDFEPEKIFWPGARDGEWIEDAGFSIKYDGGFFGGSIGVGTTTKDGREDVVSSTAKFNSLNAWLMPFGPCFKLTAGVGIGASFADSLGADPGLRIYDSNEDYDLGWDSSINPDNITQDEGVLLEGFLGPVSLALAGRYYTPVIARWTQNEKDQTDWKYIEEKNFSYGARIGYEIGEWGKVNASYLMEFQSASPDGLPVRDGYWTLDWEGKVVPEKADAEKAVHMFGVYGTLTPLMTGFGVTVGYVGELTKYLDEIYTAKGDPLEVTWPLMYQQAVNLNMRYEGLERWVFRTDHNFSFWTNKDYRIFGLPGTESWNLGLQSAIAAEGYADVNHLLLWNGLGVNYQINNNWKVDLYVRNLYRQDTAENTDMASTMQTGEYRYVRDELKGELKAIWQPNGLLEFSAGIEVSYKMTIMSKDINLAWVAEGDEKGTPQGFVSAEAADETRDSTLIIKIPVGITVRLR